MKKLLIVCSMGILALVHSAVFAQYCVPTSQFGTTQNDFINGVTLGTISNLNTGGTQGTTYNNYTSQSTNLSAGATFQLVINAGPTINDTYAAWIDYNNNQLFTDTLEKLGEVTATVAGQTLTITFTVPPGVNLDTTRLRVRNARQTTNLNPCTNYTRGETEDYSVVLVAAGGAPPIAAFGANPVNTSLGNTVAFVDSSLNTPTSWQWTFAGGTPSTSNLQNPTGIVYNSVGCYAVTLTVTNAAGSNTLTRTCYVIVQPANPYCSSLHSVNCSAINNINGVTITGTPLNNVGSGCGSASGTAYTAYTSSQYTATLYRGNNYQLNVTTSSSNLISCWIDYNQNNTFEASEWTQITTASTANLASTVILNIPSNASLGTTRMRIRSRSLTNGGGGGGTPNTITGTDACTSFQNGETEDYQISIDNAPPQPPVASFTSNTLSITQGQSVSFTDLSSNNPTAWQWTFTGAAVTSSTVQNPSGIVYPTPGCYDVKLRASNAQGADSLIQVCYLTVNPPEYCSTLHSVNCSGADNISRFSITGTSLQNSTACGSLNGNAFSVYPAADSTTATLYTTGSYQMNVTTTGTKLVGIWIDYNHDIAFDTTEFISVTNQSVTNVPSSVNIVIPGNALTGNTRMRVRSRSLFNGGGGGGTNTLTAANACTIFQNGETEDYVIQIQPPPPLTPVAAFSADSVNIFSGQNVDFSDLSTNLPTSWSWSFPGGVPSSSTQQNPQNIVYATPGCYPVTLIAGNSFGNDTISVTCYITVTTPPICNTGLHTANCSVNDNINTVSIAGTTLNNANTGCNGSTTSLGYNLFPFNGNTTASLFVGGNYSISVTTNVARIIGMWIDYNQNNQFDASEFTQVTTNSTANVASTVSFLIPSTALLGPTRMRIRSRNPAGALTATDACTTFGSGETEDYTITLASPPQLPPVAAFSANALTVNAGSTVNFSDLSSNIPTTWNWTFTGGLPATSNSQNPTGITYNNVGCYAVTLIATNAFGSDTAFTVCYINVVPPPYCSNLHTNTCAGGGGGAVISINTVAISGTTFNNANTGCTGTSGNSYTIYSPSAGTTAVLNRGAAYDFSVTTSATANISIWIDFNQNTQFDANEWYQVAASVPGNIPATISIPIPSTALTGITGMRVRCRSTAGSNIATDACTSFGTGETEDYKVTIAAGGNNPPEANFAANFTSISPFGSINFSDLSTNTPTAWSWSFPGGSPSTSSVQNPSGIVYGTPGTYSVTLIASNAFGSDTLTLSNYITVTQAASFCIPVHSASCTNNFINAVQIVGTTLNNANTGCTSLDGQAFTAYPATGSTTASINRNQSYSIRVTTNTAQRISVWIDYNHNNIFEASEWTQIATTSTPNVASTATLFIPNTAVAGPTGMRIRSRVITGGGGGGTNGANDPCTSFPTGETEDYTINIFNPSLIPVADFIANSNTTICQGGSVSFTNTSSNNPLVYQWNFQGAADTTSSSENATATYPNAGTFTVSLTATNGNGSNTKTVNAMVTVLPNPLANAGPDTTICIGSAVQLQATGGTGYSWSPAQNLTGTNIANPIANPQTTTTYVVNVSTNGCTSSDTVIVTINNPALNGTAGVDVNVCRGASVNMNASGGTDYQWSPSTGLSASNVSNPQASPTNTTTYNVTIFNGNCSFVDQVVVNVVGENATAGLDVTVCPGNTAALGASGGANYFWTPSTGLSNPTIANPVVSPLQTSTYVVSIINGTCVFVDTLVVNVGNVSANAGADASICAGSSTQLLATGGASYSWSPSTGLSDTTLANPIASPSSTTTYVVTASSGNCTAVDTLVVTVVPGLNLSAGADLQVCQGGTVVLSASSNGANSYSWSPASLVNNPNSASTQASPLVNTTFVVLASNAFCEDTDTIEVSILPLPATPVLNANTDGTISAIAADAATFVWFLDGSNIAASGSTITPPQDGLYTALAVSSGGCLSDTSAGLPYIITSLFETATANKLVVMPNPANDRITISCDLTLDTSARLCLFDLSGRMVMEIDSAVPSGTYIKTVDITSLSPGTYVLSVFSNGVQTATRIIRQ
jgi:PKD repeat protein